MIKIAEKIPKICECKGKRNHAMADGARKRDDCNHDCNDELQDAGALHGFTYQGGTHGGVRSKLLFSFQDAGKCCAGDEFSN